MSKRLPLLAEVSAFGGIDACQSDRNLRDQLAHRPVQVNRQSRPRTDSLLLEDLLLNWDCSQPAPSKHPASRRVIHVKVVSISNPCDLSEYASLPKVGLLNVRRTRYASKISVIEAEDRPEADYGPRSPCLCLVD